MIAAFVSSWDVRETPFQCRGDRDNACADPFASRS